MPDRVRRERCDLMRLLISAARSSPGNARHSRDGSGIIDGLGGPDLAAG